MDYSVLLAIEMEEDKYSNINRGNNDLDNLTSIN